MESRYDKFTSLILNIARSITKIRCMEMEGFGLKGNQVQVMFHLYQNPKGKSLNELCQLCFEDKGALSRAIDGLEAKGLVSLVASEKKYRNPYVLTEAGLALGKKIERLTTEMVDKGSAGIREDERAGFYEKLALVDKNLAKVCKEYGRKQ